MQRLLLGLLAGASAVALAQENWAFVSDAGSHVFEVKLGSVERTTTDRTNEPIIAFLVRAREKATTNMTFQKVYVKLTDCAAGYGKIVTTDLNGKAKYDNDFVLNGGTAGSTMADFLCAIAKGTEDISPASKP